MSNKLCYSFFIMLFPGTILTCRTAMIDLGLSDVDPGMVPDGA